MKITVVKMLMMEKLMLLLMEKLILMMKKLMLMMEKMMLMTENLRQLLMVMISQVQINPATKR